jgi:hypothetical protein
MSKHFKLVIEDDSFLWDRNRDRGQEAFLLLPSHTTGHTGTYPAVRKVEVQLASLGTPIRSK